MTKKAKTFKGKSMKLGGGGQFAKGVSDIMAKGFPKKMAEGIMAKRGMAKYGQKKMTKMAVAGKKKKKGKK